MRSHTVRLYGYATSPFVLKTGVFLKYKQVPFEFVPVEPVFPSRQLRQFPGQRRVPVLTIDEEWRADSTPLGIWLDEVFPDRPILGDTPEETRRILEIDQWVNDQLIMGRFRSAMKWENVWDSLRNGWSLARIVNDATPIPLALRIAWPFIVRHVGFVRRFGHSVGQSESPSELRERQLRELQAHIGEGPFLGGRSRVSLADLSAYATVAMPHLLGLHGPRTFLEDPDVVTWCRRVQEHLPANPFVVPDHLVVRPLP